MAYFVTIYDWSLYTLPSALATTDIEGATYGHGTPSWLGETFTFNGGSSTALEIDDDDPDFEDAYVETGGPQTLAQDVTINGTTYLAGSVVENEFSMLDASGNEIWVVRIDGVNVGFSYPVNEDPTSGQTFTGTTGRDGDPADSQDGTSSSEPYSGLICFTPGALIDTPDGLRPVETLKPDDPVMTLDSGSEPIRWNSRRRIVFRNDQEDAKPIKIKAGALAPGVPRHDLVVSPQHRFVFTDKGKPRGVEVLVAAKALTQLPGVRTMCGKKSVEYVHFALDRHEIVFANGTRTESCFMGPVALEDIAKPERARIRSTFPNIEFDPVRGYGSTARPVLTVQDARRLLVAQQLTYDAANAPSCGKPVAANNG